MATVEATHTKGCVTSGLQAEHVEATWLTIPELSKITGKKQTALRMWIKRKVQSGQREYIKKDHEKHGDKWLVHSSMINMLGQHVESHVMAEHAPTEHVEATRVDTQHCYDNTTEHVDLISFKSYLDERRDWQQERDNLMQGLLMYRYKFEEVDRQLKILPAPPEYVKSKIDELEKDLQEEARAKSLLAIEKAQTEEEKEQLRKDYEDFLSQLRAKLSEEERINEELKAELERAMADLKRPWWKKLFGIK